MNYAKQLAERQSAASVAEKSIMTHFGPEAENCLNWPALWRIGRINELTNSDSGQVARGLPLDQNGVMLGWVTTDGAHANPPCPSIYTDRFLYYLALQLANGTHGVQQQLGEWLPDGDEMDCNELANWATILTDLLHQDRLQYLAVTGSHSQVNTLGVPANEEAEFMASVKVNSNASGVLLNRQCVVLPGGVQVRSKEARRVLQAVTSELERQRAALKANAGLVPIEPPTETDKPTVDLAEYFTTRCSLDLCDKAAKKVGLEVGKGADTHADLRVHALVAALKRTHSLQMAEITVRDFRPILAEWYGVLTYNHKYRPQHTKGGPSGRIKKWDDVFNSAHDFLTNHYKEERRKK